MPRPNPPRKRRRPPAGNRVRADAALNKQTAQSSSGQQPAKPASRPAKAEVITAPPPDEMWSRRSYAVTIAVLAVLELVITTIQWFFVTPPRAPVYDYWLLLNPISLLVGSIIAPIIGRYLTHERRPLRPIESVMIGVVAYFVYIFVYTGITFLLVQSGNGGTTSGSVATPCPATSTCVTPSPSAGASASAQASATSTQSTSAVASPAASASPNPNAVVNVELTPDIVGANLAGDIVTFVATLYIYPPLYKRLRVRRPPPQRQRPPRQPRTATQARSDAKATRSEQQQSGAGEHSPTAPKPPRRWPWSRP